MTDLLKCRGGRFKELQVNGQVHVTIPSLSDSDINNRQMKVTFLTNLNFEVTEISTGDSKSNIDTS